MNKSTIDRREAIKKGLRWSFGIAAGASLISCDPNQPPLPPCPWTLDPLEWAPSVLQPVFYGYVDYGTSVGAPANLRVYYPSPESPATGVNNPGECAPFLGGPGHFPLVLFLHGNCSETSHYTKWSYLPKVLARSGFIVAIPDLGFNDEAPWTLSNSRYSLINNIIDWMRSKWSHRQFLMNPPTLGIVGHSYGALLGGQLAVTIPATAYVSLGGVWPWWSPPGSAPIKMLTLPKLLVWGTGGIVEGPRAALSEGAWNSLPQPKYRLVFPKGEHWDYVPSPNTSCAANNGDTGGPCNLVYALTADLTALFLSKYMPPEGAPRPPFIGADLIPPTVELVPPNEELKKKQLSFASGHLLSFQMFGTRPSCSALLTWVTSDGGSATRSFPL